MKKAQVRETVSRNIPDTGPTVQPAAEYAALSSLKPWAKNPKGLDDADVDELVASITRFGFGAPLVARRANREIIEGHLRFAAAMKMGLDAVPVRFMDLSEGEAHALAIAATKLEKNRDFEEDMLAARLKELLDDDVDVTTGTGFADFEVAKLLNKIREDDAPDDVAPTEGEELRKKWGTELGQLWSIGSHRLLCGSSTDAGDVARLMAGVAKARVMNTDPPYGVDYVALKKGMPGFAFSNATRDAVSSDIANDELDGVALQAFLESAIRAALPYLEERAAFYFWHPMLTQGTFFAAAAAAADILIHRQIIWVKPGFVLTRSGMYHWQHELCFYGWVRGKQPAWYGDKSQTSVWECGRDDDAGMHPTQKPIELFVRPIENHTKPGDVVYEPFSGSGSQLVAAHRTGRVCCAMELDPRYVAVALERLSRLGLKPALVS